MLFGDTKSGHCSNAQTQMLSAMPALPWRVQDERPITILCTYAAGIVADEVVEKMPPVLVSLCKRLVRSVICISSPLLCCLPLMHDDR